jgi:hypothetical protein
VNVIRDLIDAKEWDRIEPAWKTMTKEINRWHEEFAHGFLVWKVSDNPPEDLDLTPLD